MKLYYNPNYYGKDTIIEYVFAISILMSLSFYLSWLLVPIIIPRFKNNQKELIESHSRFENNWKKVNSKFLAEIENIMDFKWDIYKFKCYISLVSKGGIHNSSKNFIVVNYRWKENSNYIIAHELFHIIFRNYITRFFKEKYDNFDEDLSEIIVNFIMLDHEKTKLLFPNIKFSIGIFPKKLQENAKKIYPLWKSSPSFKEFMIESYKKLGIEKTWVSY